MRIMALDYGERRVGVAISDPLRVIAQPLVTLRASPRKELIKRLKFIAKQYEVGLVLVGNPVSHQGKATNMSQKIKRFIAELEHALTIRVQEWDERFTSSYARKLMKEKGIKKQKDKLDQVAACIMLDEFLKRESACST
jgi:putative Holliday junction resolvase